MGAADMDAFIDAFAFFGSAVLSVSVQYRRRCVTGREFGGGGGGGGDGERGGGALGSFRRRGRGGWDLGSCGPRVVTGGA